MEGVVFFVRIKGAHRAPEGLRLSASRDRAGHHPHTARHHHEGHTGRDGARAGAGRLHLMVTVVDDNL